MCTSAILNLLYCDHGKPNTSTSISFRDNARCSRIQSKNDNNKGMLRVIKILLFQTTISIVSYMRKRECELLKRLSQKVEAKAIHPNECKIVVNVESFSCLMLTTTLKRNLVHCALCNVSAIWTKLVSDLFCLNQY